MELRKTRRDYVKVTSGYFVCDHVVYGGNAIAGRAMNEEKLSSTMVVVRNMDSSLRRFVD